MSISRKALEDLKKARDVYEALAGAADALEELRALEQSIDNMKTRSESLGKKIEKQEGLLAKTEATLAEAEKKLQEANKKNVAAFKDLTDRTDAFIGECEARSKVAADMAVKAEAKAEKARAELVAVNQQIEERKVVLGRMVANAG